MSPTALFYPIKWDNIPAKTGYYPRMEQASNGACPRIINNYQFLEILFPSSISYSILNRQN